MALVVIVGGGVIGCACAERLVRAGHQVTLLERDHVGAQASGAAAGLLAPYSEAQAGEDELGVRSLGMFPDLVERIEREGGVEVEFRTGESITPALTAAEEIRLQRRRRGRWVERAECLRLEPELSGEVRGAIITEEAQVTPSRFVRALVRTAVAGGGEVREGAPVAAVVKRGGRVVGVQTPGGILRADWVVLAAGPWTPELVAGLAEPVDVRPMRGQLVSLGVTRRVLGRMLTWQGYYIVPKPDGSLVVGSTEEDSGFDTRPTSEGIGTLLDFARRAVPALGAATVERVWAALRPATSDGKPIVGPMSGLPNLVVATGHNRNGILLAPVTAELIANGIAGSWD